MRILYVHQYFTTRSGAGGTRSYEFARALISQGHQVTMVCASAGRSVTGLDGPFANARRDGIVDGIHVIEYDISYTNHDPVWKRAMKFVAFSWHSTIEALRQEYDVIYTTTTPLTASIPGAAAKLIRGKPFVFEVRDLWPELPRAMGMRNPIALAGMHLLEWLGYRTATQLVALAPGIANGIARLGISPARIAMIPNGCDLELFQNAVPVTPQELAPGRIAYGALVAVFAGAHGMANGLDALIAVASELKGRNRNDIALLLIGEGATKPALIAQAERAGLNNVIFQDSIPKLRLAGLLKRADIGLQVLADIPAFYDGTSPNKFFDYLSAGLPVLINYPGWLAGLVRQQQCGFAVAPGSAKAFADALESAADNRDSLRAMSDRALALAGNQFDRQVLAGQFVSVIEQAVRPV